MFGRFQNKILISNLMNIYFDAAVWNIIYEILAKCDRIDKTANINDIGETCHNL